MCRVAILLMLTSLLCSVASSAGDIVMRTAVEPAEAWVGQRVVLKVDVLAEDGWAQISRFGEVDVPGAYLIRTDSLGTRLQEDVDGAAYTGQRYEVSIYPQLAGAIEVPAVPVEVTIKTWGADAKQQVQQRQTPPVMIKAKAPPGAEGVRGLISTTRLTAVQDWMPVNESPGVGDALQRTVTFEADDVSGMAFAPLEHADLPGVGIYPDEPEVADSSGRGSLSGRRTEAVTYVFERAGKVQIPDIEVTWWNVSAAKLETVNLPGRELEVAPGPAGEPGAGLSASMRLSTLDLWLAGASLLAAAAMLLRFGRPLAQRWSAWRRLRRESEAHYFKTAISSVRSNNARLALRDIMRWLDRTNDEQAPAQLQRFARRYTGEDARVLVDQLLHAVATDGHLAEPAPVIGLLNTMRQGWRDARRPRSGHAVVLPELNH